MKKLFAAMIVAALAFGVAACGDKKADDAKKADAPAAETSPETDEPAPYVHVRAGLDALIDRKSFYRLVDQAVVEQGAGRAELGVWSGSTFFAFRPAEGLVP